MVTNLYKKITLLSAAACGVCGLAFGQSTAYTAPVGYVSQTCKGNSDTIVNLPLRISTNYSGTISAVPDTSTVPGSAILSLSGTPGLTTDAFASTHYAKFANTTPAAAGDGQWFVITTNTSSTITVNLNGAAIDAVSGARLEILKFWTLSELFNPTVSTNSAASTGNAIVTSAGTGLSARRTTILIPDLAGAGTNLAPTQVFYIHENAGDLSKTWRNANTPAANSGSYQLWPDTYFIIRHPSAVTASTTYTATGEVESGDFSVSLSTRAVGAQDNFVGIPRPVDVSLGNLNLGGTSGFMTSTGVGASGRRDQLLIFDNQIALRNKVPSLTYFYYSGKWLRPGDINATPTRENEVIAAGVGFIIRKYQTGTGATAIWNNAVAY
jgi:uncharacterized protein (TIGR02597 family)